MGASTGAHRLIRASFATEESIYGVILVAGLIVAAGAHGGSSVVVFTTVLVTVVVFWLAHLYAGTVAGHGIGHEGVMSLGEAFRRALRRSLGMLLASVLPMVILLLGVLNAIPDTLTNWLALWTCVAVLAVLGFIAYARRGAPWWMRVLGALSTAAFGVLLIVAKAFIH